MIKKESIHMNNESIQMNIDLIQLNFVHSSYHLDDDWLDSIQFKQTQTKVWFNSNKYNVRCKALNHLNRFKQKCYSIHKVKTKPGQTNTFE